MKTAQGYVRLISSADAGEFSVMELNILPGEKTPWHYHDLFSETFEVVSGSLLVGKGRRTYHLARGETATIQPNENHFYHNISNEECVIKVTIEPGNKNFENALFLLKGLANDGLATRAGTPRKLIDLVLFVYLSNSKMTGFQKLAEPVFIFLALRAIKKGYLDKLIARYGDSGITK